MSGFPQRWRRTALTWLALMLGIVLAISACATAPRAALLTARYDEGPARAGLAAAEIDDDEEDDDEELELEARAESEALRASELRLCSHFSGVAMNDIVLVTRELPAATVVPEGRAVAVKIAGDRSSLRLDVAEGGAPLAALCVFAAGESPRVEIGIGTEVKALRYDGKGNAGRTAIHVVGGGKVSGPFRLVLGGNEPEVTLDGEGEYSCPAIDRAGRAPAVLSDRCS